MIISSLLIIELQHSVGCRHFVSLYRWRCILQSIHQHNQTDLAAVALPAGAQKHDRPESGNHAFNETLAMPVALSPVGLYRHVCTARRSKQPVPLPARGCHLPCRRFPVCPIEEVAPAIDRPMWFQLYVLKDRGFMRNALERAKASGVNTLVFTVDMPVPGALS